MPRLPGCNSTDADGKQIEVKSIEANGAKVGFSDKTIREALGQGGGIAAINSISSRSDAEYSGVARVDGMIDRIKDRHLQKYMSKTGDVVDYVPILGDAKGAAEFLENPSLIGFAAVVAGAIPIAGDFASKFLRKGDEIAEMVRAAEEVPMLKMATEACCCFAAGTLAYTANGLQAIETLQVGDFVWAKDQASGITELKPVTELFATQAKPLYALTTQAADGKLETVEVTDNHPYWVIGTGWVDSGLLKPGMRIEAFDRGALVVESLVAKNVNEVTYNFTVGDFHTYFVGGQRALVHNCSCWKGFSKGQLSIHFTKHGTEFGEINQNDYLRMAKDFGSATGFKEQNIGNFLIKYDQTGNRMLIGRADTREIRTFYRPDGRDADPMQAAIDYANSLIR